MCRKLSTAFHDLETIPMDVSHDFHLLPCSVFAKGTLAANLSPTAAFSDTERPLLPAVTMVFAAVHDGKALVRKNEQIAAYVHSVLTRVMQVSSIHYPSLQQDHVACACCHPCKGCLLSLWTCKPLFRLPMPDPYAIGTFMSK